MKQKGSFVSQVARRRTHQGGLPHLRQHHPLLQSAGETVAAADAGGVRHRRYNKQFTHMIQDTTALFLLLFHL